MVSDPFPSRPIRRRRTLEERLAIARLSEEKAAERLAQKARRVQKYEAAQRQRERKLDTRRKIIAGALALEHMIRSPEWGGIFRALLDEYVIRDEERLLFGLPALPPDEVERALAAQREKGLRRKGSVGS